MNESTNSSIIDQFFSQFFGDNEEEDDADFQLDFLDDLDFDALQQSSSDQSNTTNPNPSALPAELNFFESDDDDCDVDENIDVAEVQEIKKQTELFIGQPVSLLDKSNHFQTRRSKTGYTPEKLKSSQTISFSNETSNTNTTLPSLLSLDTIEADEETLKENSKQIYTQFLKYFETNQTDFLLPEEDESDGSFIEDASPPHCVRPEKEEYNGVIFIHEFNPVEHKIHSDKADLEEFRDDLGVQISAQEVRDLIEDCSEFIQQSSSSSSTPNESQTTTTKESDLTKKVNEIMELKEKYCKPKEMNPIKRKRGRPRKEETEAQSASSSILLLNSKETSPIATTSDTTCQQSSTSSSSNPSQPPSIASSTSNPISIIIEPPMLTATTTNTDTTNSIPVIMEQNNINSSTPNFVNTPPILYNSFLVTDLNSSFSIEKVREIFIQQLFCNIQITIQLFLLCKEIYQNNNNSMHEKPFPVSQKSPNSPSNAIHITNQLVNQLIQIKYLVQQFRNIHLNIPAFRDDSLFQSLLQSLHGQSYYQSRNSDSDFPIKSLLFHYIFTPASNNYFDQTMFSDLMVLFHRYRRSDFKHVVERLRFTPAEDDLLAMGLEKYGHTRWKKIQEQFLPTKEPKQIENRYKNMRCSTRADESHPIKKYREDSKKRPREETLEMKSKPIQIIDYSNEVITSLKNQNRQATKSILGSTSQQEEMESNQEQREAVNIVAMDFDRMNQLYQPPPPLPLPPPTQPHLDINSSAKTQETQNVVQYPESKRIRLDQIESSSNFNPLLFASNTKDTKTKLSLVACVEEPSVVQFDENENLFEYQKTIQNSTDNCIHLKDGNTLVFSKEDDTRIIEAVKRNLFLDKNDTTLIQQLKELKESNLIQDELKNKFLKCRYLQLKEKFLSFQRAKCNI